MVTTGQEVKSFLDAWDDYNQDIKKALLKCQSEPPPVLSSKKFKSLNELDKLFESTINPIVERFFKRNLLVLKGGKWEEVEDKRIYEKFKYSAGKYLLTEKPLPPRIRKISVPIDEYGKPTVPLNDFPIECEKDVWKIIDTCRNIENKDLYYVSEYYERDSIDDYETAKEEFKERAALGESYWDKIWIPMTIESQWEDYKSLVIALHYREEEILSNKEMATFELQRDHKNIVKLGTLKKQGQEKEYALTARPARAMRELIIATNEGQTDPEWIKERIINCIPEWKEKCKKRGAHDLGHSEKEIRKAVKSVFDVRYTPWYPLPIEIKIV